MDNFNLNDEIEDVAQVKSEEDAKLSTLDKRDESYTKLINAYKDYYIDKSKVNIILRKCFLWLSFGLLFALIIGCILISVFGCIYLNGVFGALVSVISSIASITTSTLVLPRIIASYLFPNNEDKEIKELILFFKDSDDSIRLNKKEK
ncbi:MAG: hypothetical protein IJW43_05395 [Clostridia bacterium]|nr:hypothetical protein [Clostridia bacterium]